MGDSAVLAVPFLICLLVDNEVIDPNSAEEEEDRCPVSIVAGIAIEEIGKKAIDQCLDVLNQSSYEQRAAIVRLLGTCELQDQRILETLASLLAHSDAGVRRSAADNIDSYLGINPSMRCSPAVVAALINTLNDRIEFVRIAAISVLGHVKDPSATEPLLPFLKDKNEDVRRLTLRTLEQIGDRRATPAVLAIVQNEKEDPTTREYATRAVGKLNDPSTVEPLIQLLTDKKTDEHLRMDAIVGLGGTGDRRAMEPLMTVLKNHSEVPLIARASRTRHR